MYEVSFAKLSEVYFQGTTWPPVQYISGLVDDDSVFCLLYKVSHQIAVMAARKMISSTPWAATHRVLPDTGDQSMHASAAPYRYDCQRRKCSSGIYMPRCSQPCSRGVSHGTTTARCSTSSWALASTCRYVATRFPLIRLCHEALAATLGLVDSGCTSNLSTWRVKSLLLACCACTVVLLCFVLGVCSLTDQRPGGRAKLLS